MVFKNGENDLPRLMSQNQVKNLEDRLIIPPQKPPILCLHCKRTESNGIRCLGICVSDSEY